MNDIKNEDAVVQAEIFSSEEEPHPHALDLDFLGEDHNSYKAPLKNLVDGTEVEANLRNLESPTLEEEHPHSLDTDFLGEDHNGYKSHLKNLVDDTEVDANLNSLE